LIYKAVYNLLSNDSAITGIVGTNIFPRVADMSATYPMVIYKRSDADHIESTTGSSGLAAGLMEVECYSKDFNESRDLCEKVRLLLQGYSGTAAGVVVQHSALVSDTDDDIQSADGSEDTVFVGSMGFRMMYEEVIPP